MARTRVCGAVGGNRTSRIARARLPRSMSAVCRWSPTIASRAGTGWNAGPGPTYSPVPTSGPAAAAPAESDSASDGNVQDDSHQQPEQQHQNGHDDETHRQRGTEPRERLGGRQSALGEQRTPRILRVVAGSRPRRPGERVRAGRRSSPRSGWFRSGRRTQQPGRRWASWRCRRSGTSPDDAAVHCDHAWREPRCRVAAVEVDPRPPVQPALPAAGKGQQGRDRQPGDDSEHVLPLRVWPDICGMLADLPLPTVTRAARDQGRNGSDHRPARCGGCHYGGVSTPQLPEITISDLPDGAVILDVREDDEWAAGHAPSAVHVPMGQVADRLSDLPEGDPVYVVCRAGGRSARVTEFLNASGWDAVNVAGGMGAWAAAGKPLSAEHDGDPTII